MLLFPLLFCHPLARGVTAVALLVARIPCVGVDSSSTDRLFSSCQRRSRNGVTGTFRHPSVLYVNTPGSSVVCSVIDGTISHCAQSVRVSVCTAAVHSHSGLHCTVVHARHCAALFSQDIVKEFCNNGLEHWGSDSMGIEKTRRFFLEWQSFLCRYVREREVHAAWCMQRGVRAFADVTVASGSAASAARSTVFAYCRNDRSPSDCLSAFRCRSTSGCRCTRAAAI